MTTSSGQRNARIRFEAPTQSPDGAGNMVDGWSPLCGPVWARVLPIAGREEVLAQRLAGVKPFEISVLSSTATRTITTGCRAINDRTGEIYAIVDLGNPDERGVDLVMLVKKGIADG